MKVAKDADAQNGKEEPAALQYLGKIAF